MSKGDRLVEIVAKTMAVIRVDSIPNPIAEDSSLEYFPQDGELEAAKIELGIGPLVKIKDIEELDGLYSRAVKTVIFSLQSGIYNEGVLLAEHGIKEEGLEVFSHLTDGQIEQASFEMFEAMKKECEVTYQLFAKGFSDTIIKSKIHEGDKRAT